MYISNPANYRIFCHINWFAGFLNHQRWAIGYIYIHIFIIFNFWAPIPTPIPRQRWHSHPTLEAHLIFDAFASVSGGARDDEKFPLRGVGKWGRVFCKNFGGFLVEKFHPWWTCRFGLIFLATCGQTLNNTTVLFCFDLKIMVGELVCGYQRKFKLKTSDQLLEQVAIAVATSCYSVLYTVYCDSLRFWFFDWCRYHFPGFGFGFGTTWRCGGRTLPRELLVVGMEEAQWASIEELWVKTLLSKS